MPARRSPQTSAGDRFMSHRGCSLLIVVVAACAAACAPTLPMEPAGQATLTPRPTSLRDPEHEGADQRGGHVSSGAATNAGGSAVWPYLRCDCQSRKCARHQRNAGLSWHVNTANRDPRGWNEDRPRRVQALRPLHRPGLLYLTQVRMPAPAPGLTLSRRWPRSQELVSTTAPIARRATKARSLIPATRSSATCTRS
jgi:hypothetical protein